MLGRTILRPFLQRAANATINSTTASIALQRRTTTAIFGGCSTSLRHQSTDAAAPTTNGASQSSPYDDSAELAAGYDSTDHALEECLQDPNRPDPTGRTMTYIATGSAAFLYASVARVAVMKFLATWSASADVLALSSLEVDLSGIEEGTSSTVKWRGKPVFVRHRNAKEIGMAHEDDKLVESGGLRDPELDKDRVQEDPWIVVVGVCTHLGCVPIPNSGDYDGWFCPCHGSHYDTSGRARKGPAPLNLEVPQYKFLSPQKILIG